MMGKSQTPPDKAEELRAATRAANEIHGDLKRTARDIETRIENGFEERVTACMKNAEARIAQWIDGLADDLRQHADRSHVALTNRWAYIESMLVADSGMARLIAMHVLKEAGGTVKTDKAQWWLVKEIKDEDGTSTFAFPKQLANRADDDPETQKAVMDAVSQHRPEFLPFPWRSNEYGKGLNEK